MKTSVISRILKLTRKAPSYFDPLTPSHYEALGRLLIQRNRLRQSCAGLQQTIKGTPAQDTSSSCRLTSEMCSEILNFAERAGVRREILALLKRATKAAPSVVQEAETVLAATWFFYDGTAHGVAFTRTSSARIPSLKGYSAVDIDNIRLKLESIVDELSLTERKMALLNDISSLRVPKQK